MSQTARPSPFLSIPPFACADSLAVLHLKRDTLLPIKLLSTADDGYAEGAVTNTRFGSFPHTTLIGAEWGSQIRASKVDTGTRGRKAKHVRQADQQNGDEVEESMGKKRKLDEQPTSEASVKKVKHGVVGVLNGEQKDPSAARVPTEAGSGFVHLLPPTPESWTSSLDHRTQVVYTPDYSFVLQRLGVRPGNRIIEAGAGSGSFTHAAARAIFDGYPNPPDPASDRPQFGKVYSYEFHEPRVQTLRDEIADHNLEGIVELTHRDVCNDGFLLSDSTAPSVDAIFLDLPAPWHALKFLTRDIPNSPLNPDSAIHLCTFSPCIEQVMATVSALRKAGWVDIDMFEVQHKRIDIRRERIGLKEEGLRGVSACAASVEEAVGRLREVETKLSEFHGNRTNVSNREDVAQERKIESKQERLERLKREAEERKLYREGHLVSRAESEVKTHTSYLVFATLPRNWSEEDEQQCLGRWPVDEIMKMSTKDMKTDHNGNRT